MTVDKTNYYHQENPSSANLDTASTTGMITFTNHIPVSGTVRLISFTILISSFVLGAFILASVYVQNNIKCQCGLGQHPLESQNSESYSDRLSGNEDASQENPNHLPVHIRMNGIGMGDMQSNGKFSCEITKKTASQVIISRPKEVQTPFGNVTTDPRVMNLNGEKITITCGPKDEMQKEQEMHQPRVITVLGIRPITLLSKSSEDDKSSSQDSNENQSADLATTTSPAATPVTSPTGSVLMRHKRETESAENAMNCHCKPSP